MNDPYRTAPPLGHWFVETQVVCGGDFPFATMHASFHARDADDAIRQHEAFLEEQGCSVLMSAAEAAPSGGTDGR